MSWDVGDDEWLTQPSAVPGSGPIDALDDRVIRSLTTSAYLDEAAPDRAEAPAEPPVEAYALTSEDLPPPPYSAAFDADQETPSYESGSFVADPEEEASERAAVEVDDSEPEPDFHIPTLSLGAMAALEASVESTPEAPPPSAPEPALEPAPFVIPTLSVGPSEQPEIVEAEIVEAESVEAESVEAESVEAENVEAESVEAQSVEAESVEAESVEEVTVEEFEEVEALEAEQPIRTGDTVITRAPEPSPPIPTITEAVYDDEDDDDESAGLVIPELVERVDSSELEVVLDDAEVDGAPVEYERADGPASSSGFVIPTLLADDDVVIPSSLLLTSPGVTAGHATLEAPTPIERETEVAEIAEVADATEEMQEVDAEAIESLDAADLEEVDQPVAVVHAIEPVEPKPPTPPELKGQNKRRKAWYDDVFAEHFLFLYPLTWEATCERDATFIFALIGGQEGSSVLDVGCGDGRHAVELAKLGARVTGLDNSLALLLAAAQTKESAELEDGRVEFIHGDMRRLPRDRDFDAVICVGTTLGYFEEDQNWLCLQEMHDRLRPGGRLLIHVFNRDFVAPQLPSRSWWQGKRCMVIDEAEMNFFANRLRVHRTIIFDDGRQYEHYMFMRAYTVQDLGKAISQLGMRVLEVAGSRDTRGRFYGSASPDIWIVAEKK